MRFLLCSVLLFAGLTTAVPVKADVLDAPDEIRLSDPKKAQQLLHDIDFNALTQDQQYRYRYIEIYLSTLLEADLAKTIDRYELFLATLPDIPVKVRATQSLLALTAYKAQWRKSFALASQLKKLLSELDVYNLEPDAYHGLMIFYQASEQPKIALSYASKIYNHPAATPQNQCAALAVQNLLRLEENDPTLSKDNFKDGISICRAIPQPYYVAWNYMNLFEFLVQKGELEQAEIIAEEAGRRIENIGFEHFTSGFLMAKAVLKHAQSKFEEARALAIQVIESDQNNDNRESVIEAHALIANLAAQEKDFELAYEYEKRINDLTGSFHDAQVAKSLAIQQARFDLENKENQISLLDKKNQLLTTETELVKEQVSSMVMVVVLAVLAVFFLLFWSYRARKVQKRLKQLASTDYLTGISNRGYFSEQSLQILKVADSNAEPVALIFADLDHFKTINDTHGHQVGDWVLKAIVQCLADLCKREKYKLGRIGGEEFGIIMPDTDSLEAIAFAEECRKSVQSIDSLDTGLNFTVTASFGVSDTRQVGYNLDNLFSASDLALFQSKKYGRNQVFCYEGNHTDI